MSAMDDLREVAAAITKADPVGQALKKWREGKVDADSPKEAVASAKKSDRIPGGLAAGKKPGDFDPRALEQGIRVEMEHTTDRRIATEIAMDHLTEDPHYYETAKGSTMRNPHHALSETKRQQVGESGDEKREDMPEHVFLDPVKRRYPVKVKRHGSWEYDTDLIVAASRRARMNNEPSIEAKADKLFRERGEQTRKAMADRDSWQPKMPIQYLTEFQHAAGYQDAQTMEGTEFFKPISGPESSASSVAPMRQFKRHMDGELDYPSAIAAIIDAWKATAHGEMLSPIQRALLEVLYPGEMDLMDPFAAESLSTISKEEARALKQATEAILKEKVGWRDGLPKMLPGSTWGTVR